MDALALRDRTAAGLLELAVADLLPPERLNVAEWAARYRRLTNEGGGYVGTWDPKIAPYLTEPMQCLTRREFLTECVVGPGQCGKTTLAENWLGHSIDTDPANFLWYMQTELALQAYVKRRIEPMIEGHPSLKARIGLRSIDDSLHFKRFLSMVLELLSGTGNNLINKEAPRLVADEIDAWDAALGDVKVLLDIRRQTYGDESMLLTLSHPDRAHGLKPSRGDWSDGIMAIFADSDQRLWYWPCPSCVAWSSPCPTAARVMTLHIDKDGSLDKIEREARLVCPVNGCLIEDHHRRAMNIAGKWVGLGQKISERGKVTGQLVPRKTAGFWIVGLMSPFILGGIGGLARSYAKAAREYDATGEDKNLREVTTKGLGIPYSRPSAAGTIEAEALADRCEIKLKLGTVPAGVRFLTAWVDVQAKYFELLVRGWGVERESWVVDHQVILAEPASSSGDWDKLKEAALTRRYPLADNSGRMMALRGVGFDSSGEAGVTTFAYDAWRRWARERMPGAAGGPSLSSMIARKYGQAAGRDAWSVVPTKGTATLKAPQVQLVYPDTGGRKDRASGARGDVPLLLFNADLFKDALIGQLHQAIPGRWYVHFPAELKAAEPPHPFFEQLVSERRDHAGRWSKEHPTTRNEALDMMVGTHAVAHLHGLSLIKWDAPPAWAAEWDDNTFVSAADGSSSTGDTARKIADRLA